MAKNSLIGQRCQSTLDDYLAGKLSRLPGGKNNQLFCDKYNVVKHYYDINRLDREYSFSSYLNKSGIYYIPSVLAVDYDLKIVIYERLHGRKIDNINQYHISQVIKFINSIKDLKDFSIAIEACFTYEDHLNCIESRIKKIKHPIADRLYDKFSTIEYFGEIPVEETVLSPSDFGFHNILDCGYLVFLDFEYAGIDGIGKLIADFFNQPEIPVPIKYFDEFSKITSCNQEYLLHLIDLYKIKWCCIMLNELVDDSNRKFATGDINIDLQIKKVEAILNE